AEDGIRDFHVTGVQTCALPIYFDKALAEQVDTSAIEALNGSGDNPDDGAQYGQGQGKEYRDAEAVDHPGQHVPSLIVGTQPVVQIGRASCRDRGEGQMCVEPCK